MDDDLTLLNRFAKFRDDDAFTELVRRHLDLVYGVCLRRTDNRELAEELVQNVFASLARKADSLKPGVLVVGWLHRAAHLESISAYRIESSRQRNMKNFMDSPLFNDSEPARYREISPYLDQALDALAPSDRDVILLRFSSDLTLQQIGRALGKSESATQRHLQRILEKLAAILRRRGVTTSATALALMLGADFAKAAPASLSAALISKTAIASATSSGLAIVKFTTALYIMKNKAIIIVTGCLLFAGGSIAYVNTRPSPSPAAAFAKYESTASVASISKNTASRTSEEISASSTSNRLRQVSEYQKLEEKFGTSKVRFAKIATDNTLKVMDSVVRINELKKAAGKGGFDESFGVRFNDGKDQLSNKSELNLSAEQKSKIKALEDKKIAENFDVLSAFLVNFKDRKSNRTDLMEVMLSSDAENRKEMSEGDYQAVLDRHDTVLNLLRSFEIDKGISQSELLRTELPAILNAEQMVTFEKILSEREMENKSEATGENSHAKVPANPFGIHPVNCGCKEGHLGLEKMDGNLRILSGTLESMIKVAEEKTTK
jgi:RNA polymerase sigma factor (sigma-70 family)